MADLKMIGSAKIKAALNKTSERLDNEIEALKRRNAAKGNLNSGSTVKELISICCDSINIVKDEAIITYQWVIKNTLWTNQSLHDYLEKDASDQLQEILTISDIHLQKLTALIGMPELHAKTKNQLEIAYQQALTDITLHLDGSFETESSDRIKKGAKLFLGLIAKVFTTPK